MTDLNGISAWLIDMDGVLWRGNTALPGMPEFIARLRELGHRFVLVTNNAGKTPQQYIAKLAGMGVSISADEVLTSALGAAAWLSQQHPGAKVHMIGGDGVREALATYGLERVETGADYVMVGIDINLTYAKLQAALRELTHGARLISTNPDVTFPTEDGVNPGNGALVAALETASGQTATVIGKPEPTLYQLAMARLGVEPGRVVALGDRLDTDILGGQRAGVRTALLLTGVTDRATLAASTVQPDMVFDDLWAVLAALA